MKSKLQTVIKWHKETKRGIGNASQLEEDGAR